MSRSESLPHYPHPLMSSSESLPHHPRMPRSESLPGCRDVETPFPVTPPPPPPLLSPRTLEALPSSSTTVAHRSLSTISSPRLSPCTLPSPLPSESRTRRIRVRRGRLILRRHSPPWPFRVAWSELLAVLRAPPSVTDGCHYDWGGGPSGCHGVIITGRACQCQWAQTGLHSKRRAGGGGCDLSRRRCHARTKGSPT